MLILRKVGTRQHIYIWNIRTRSNSTNITIAYHQQHSGSRVNVLHTGACALGRGVYRDACLSLLYAAFQFLVIQQRGLIKNLAGKKSTPSVFESCHFVSRFSLFSPSWSFVVFLYGVERLMWACPSCELLLVRRLMWACPSCELLLARRLMWACPSCELLLTRRLMWACPSCELLLALVVHFVSIRVSLKCVCYDTKLAGAEPLLRLSSQLELLFVCCWFVSFPFRQFLSLQSSLCLNSPDRQLLPFGVLLCLRFAIFAFPLSSPFTFIVYHSRRFSYKCDNTPAPGELS